MTAVYIHYVSKEYQDNDKIEPILTTTQSQQNDKRLKTIRNLSDSAVIQENSNNQINKQDATYKNNETINNTQKINATANLNWNQSNVQNNQQESKIHENYFLYQNQRCTNQPITSTNMLNGGKPGEQTKLQRYTS